MDTRAAHTLILEVSRADQVESLHDGGSIPQTYLLRREDGYGSATFPWGGQVMAALAALRRAHPEPGVLRQLGDTLRDFLKDSFRGLGGWRCHEDDITRALDAGQVVHVTFRFAAAELFTLPWELVRLESTDRFLGELKACLIQYEWPGGRRARRELSPSSAQEHLIFGWSAAGGSVPAAEHIRAMSRSGNSTRFDPRRDVLPNLSLATLEKTLMDASASGTPVSALHVLCHGSATDGGTRGLLWNSSGSARQAELVDGASLRRVLAPYSDSLRVVVLCACQSGYSDPGNALGSISQSLHRVGIEAVVSSRLPLSKEGSVQLAETLYEAPLMNIGALRHAFLRARSHLVSLQGLDWAALQLYARADVE